jgi:cell division protein FtsB
MAADLYLYIKTFLYTFWPLLPAGTLLGLDEAAKIWWPAVARRLDMIKPMHRRWFEILILFCVTFYTGFVAWDGEHTKLTSAITERDEARGKIDALQSGTSEQQAQIGLLTREVHRLSKESEDMNASRHLPSDFQSKAALSIRNKAALLAEVTVPVASSSDNNSGSYGYDLFKTLKAIGVHAQYTGIGAQMPGETGIVIYVVDPKNPPLSARQLMDLFTECGVNYILKLWEDHNSWDPSLSIFVTRERPVSE